MSAGRKRDPRLNIEHLAPSVDSPHLTSAPKRQKTTNTHAPGGSTLHLDAPNHAAVVQQVQQRPANSPSTPDDGPSEPLPSPKVQPGPIVPCALIPSIAGAYIQTVTPTDWTLNPPKEVLQEYAVDINSTLAHLRYKKEAAVAAGSALNDGFRNEAKQRLTEVMQLFVSEVYEGGKFIKAPDGTMVDARLLQRCPSLQLINQSEWGGTPVPNIPKEILKQVEIVMGESIEPAFRATLQGRSIFKLAVVLLEDGLSGKGFYLVTLEDIPAGSAILRLDGQYSTPEELSATEELPFDDHYDTQHHRYTVELIQENPALDDIHQTLLGSNNNAANACKDIALYVPTFAARTPAQKQQCVLGPTGHKYKKHPHFAKVSSAIIDTRFKSSCGRFVNHGKPPNCTTVDMDSILGPAVTIYYSMRPILAGEILTTE